MNIKAFCCISGFMKTALWIVIVVAVIALLVLCIKSSLARTAIFSVLGVVLVATILITGIMSCYYSIEYFTTQGGVFGESISGEHNIVKVYYDGDKTFTYSAFGFSSKGNSNEYISTIEFEEKTLKINSGQTFYLNDSECDLLKNESDLLQSSIKMTFFDNENNVAFEDTITISLFCYENSLKLQLKTNGGDKAVKYWTRFLIKEKFKLHIENSNSLPKYDSLNKDKDTSFNNTLSFRLQKENDIEVNGVTINCVNLRNNSEFSFLLTTKNSDYTVAWGYYKITAMSIDGYTITINGQSELLIEVIGNSINEIVVNVDKDVEFVEPDEPIKCTLTVNISFNDNCTSDRRIALNVYNMDDKKTYTSSIDVVPGSTVAETFKGLTTGQYMVTITTPAGHTALSNGSVRAFVVLSTSNTNGVVNYELVKTSDASDVVTN